MPLTVSDPHHWAPIPAVVDWLTNRLAGDARVLEIGPGHAPFWRANVFVDFVEPSGFRASEIPSHVGDWSFVKCDIATEPLPFEDKLFDFVYCRHTLEDMYNPFPIVREMERVAKAGYIETPSPIAELCRGVDGGAPPYRGYHHHRFIIWREGDELRFVSKYPVVEYMDIPDEPLTQILRARPVYWNTYHLWEDSINVRHLQSPLHFDIPTQYPRLLSNAIAASRQATDHFGQMMDKESEIQARKSA